MMEKQTIQNMLPAYFEGTLDSENQKKIESWIAESIDNKQQFEAFSQTWQKTELLRRMKKYDAQLALEKVNHKIEAKGKTEYLLLFQRIAAILILPLIIATLYFSVFDTNKNTSASSWHTIKTGAGMRSEFTLPDGTQVFLNSNTSLSYPVAFSGLTRDIKLNGEAYFDVAENKELPFVVNTGKISVEVTGTEFKASNYSNEDLTEIVLVEGSVNLCQCNKDGERKVFHSMVAGDKAVLGTDNKLYFEKVDVEKYIAWKDGKLMFRDDTMEEVVRRLNRWYNVDIKLTGEHLMDYAYNATFEDESLTQVLELLKLSAPIDYKIVPRKRNHNSTFSKMKIEIIQK